MHGVDHFTWLLALVLLLASPVVPAMAGCGTIPPRGVGFYRRRRPRHYRDRCSCGITTRLLRAGRERIQCTCSEGHGGGPGFVLRSSLGLSERTGPWFLLPGNSLAFYVGDPTLQLRVVDYTSGFVVGQDASWVPKGDSVGFRIDTNLWVFSHRPSCTGAPLTIEVSGPGGTTFSSLGGYPLAGVVVSSPTFETGPVWPTGSSEFSIGDYEAYVRCEENKMHDNYPVTGKSESERVHFLLQKANPLIVTVTTTASPEGSDAGNNNRAVGHPHPGGDCNAATVATAVPTIIETEEPMASPTPTQAPGILPATLILAFCIAVALRTHG